jgi:hypothetical protein
MCRRSVSVKIATVILVLSMSAPAFAAPRRDDSPIGGFERAISRVVKQIKHFLDLAEITIPK